eukprot:6835799-Pyramimonas_sp.AAC.1
MMMTMVMTMMLMMMMMMMRSIMRKRRRRDDEFVCRPQFSMGGRGETEDGGRIPLKLVALAY